MKLLERFNPEVLENTRVEDKVNYLVKLTQILAISAIIAGVIGMLISNSSIRSLNGNALEPLGHLRLIKESYEQKVLPLAQNIANGSVTDYSKVSNDLMLEKEKIIREWNAYIHGHLTKEEKKLLPNAQKYMQLSIKSLDTLIELSKEKKLMDVLSWTTDDAQYTIIELTPILNELMQVQIINAQNIYATTQIKFFAILALIIIISIAGSMYVAKMVKRVVYDLTQPFDELLAQSKALANQNFDEPFVWKRTDEIGQVGKSFELSRQSLKDLFIEIQFKNKELLLKSRLAQMGEMISMIAHQWRQPLGAIASTTVNMKIKLEIESFDLNTENGRNELNTFFIDRLSKIEEYVESLSTTIDDFRNFYRPDKQLVKCTFECVVKKALKIIKESLEADNIKIHEEYLNNKQVEMFDNEMTQVLLNILKNAQDNFREKGISEPIIDVKVENNSLQICDNGGGIPDKIIEKIFDPYFSTKDEKNGTGLGLHMSRIIVEEHHNGQLNVKNHNDGVCFEIRLEKKE